MELGKVCVMLPYSVILKLPGLPTFWAESAPVPIQPRLATFLLCRLVARRAVLETGAAHLTAAPCWLVLSSCYSADQTLYLKVDCIQSQAPVPRGNDQGQGQQKTCNCHVRALAGWGEDMVRYMCKATLGLHKAAVASCGHLWPAPWQQHRLPPPKCQGTYFFRCDFFR